MSLFSFVKGLIHNKKQPAEIEILPEETELIEIETETEEALTFKSENVIFNKLNYLEQYIKIFSLTFPEEYNGYLSVIQMLKEDYGCELDEFKKGKEGNITFSIDPEQESKRYVEVLALEEDIRNFVDFEVEYKNCKDKFSKLCYKLNLFYNQTINTDIQRDVIINQLNNAYNSLEVLVNDLKAQEFFNKDSRKKDEISNYIIYCDYIVFKSFLRVGIIGDFSEYKQEISKIYQSFNGEHYDNLMFKFFIESIEEIQNLISTNLTIDKMFEFVLKESQNLERRLDEYNDSFGDYMFFQSVLKLENTIYELIKSHNIDFTFDVSRMISFGMNNKEVISINNIAKSMLSLVRNEKASLLEKIISRFKVEISWREFYFLCKIFELTDDIVKKSEDTVFSMVKNKFLRLAEKYSEYTDEYILEGKRKILDYSGTKTKKYILLIESISSGNKNILRLLETLSLDFVVNGDNVYLNHSYFNGFKNLEENFGQEITF